MSLAQGAQTLITAEAREALGETSLRIESHGFWMVKGIPEPIELFEVGDDSSPFVPPPDSEKVYRVIRDNDWWLPVKEIPHNLPHLATAFVGREREIGEVRAALEKARLVTLLAWVAWARPGSQCSRPLGCCTSSPTAFGSSTCPRCATRRWWRARPRS